VRFAVSAAAAAGVVVLTALLVTNCAPLSGVPGDPGAAAAGDGQAAAGLARQSCQVRYQTIKDANGAFDVDLTVSNTGPAAVHGWTLEFSFPGDQHIVSARSAGWSQNGSSVVLHDQGANAYIASGSAVTVGISGTYQTGNPLPTMFALRKTSCAYLLIGATGATIGAGGPAPTDGGTGTSNQGPLNGPGGLPPATEPPVNTGPPTVAPSPDPPKPTVEPTPHPTGGPPTKKTRTPGPRRTER
jgi:hypothetical protein